MPSSTKFSMILQTEILSTETSDFLKQIIFLQSFNSVFLMTKMGLLYILADNVQNFQFQYPGKNCAFTRPRGYKTFFMLNSVEHEILNAHKYKNIKKSNIF